MRIGYFDYTLDLSVRNYIDNVVRELRNCGVDLVPINVKDGLPVNVDLYWDLRLTGTTLPAERFRNAQAPLVITLHGSAPLSMLFRSQIKDLKNAVQWYGRSINQLIRWRRWKDHIAAVIVPSQSAKELSAKMFGLPRDRMYPIHHGVDHELFKDSAEKRSFFLHVSQYQPVKNFDRILSAYHQIDRADKPQLIGVVPNYPGVNAGDGVILIREKLSHTELAKYYNRCLSFIFPSLWESFGMPLVEAMACGASVITSDRYACPDVVGDAGILVDPYSVDEIRDAMLQIMQSSDKQTELRQKSIQRAEEFSWDKCARMHLTVFEELLTE